MGAFCDIWISYEHATPAGVRKGNAQWLKQNAAISLSWPDNGKHFFTQLSKGYYSLVLLGQLYETLTADELLNRCVSYIENSSTIFEDPAGHYIMFVQDESKQQTHVFTNRLGTYHAYWSADKIISTQYLPLARTKQQKILNWQGLTGFMAMGYFPGDSTYLAGISIFEPASYYCFDEQLNLVSKKRYWQWTYTPVERSEKYFAVQLHEQLQQSLRTATQNQRVCIPVSGGLDSRLLAGELTDSSMAYRDIQALSYGYTDTSCEVVIGKQVAGAAGLPVYSFAMPDYLFEQLDEITEAVELFQYVDGTRQASAVHWLNNNADVVVGGHWGDVWMDSMNISGTGDLQVAFQKKIIKKGSDWLLNNICKPHLDDTTRFLQDYFDSFIGQYEYIDDAAFRMKIYKTDQWSFRWTAASLRMYQAATMPVLPFYDKRVVDIFTTVPQHMLAGRELQVNYLKKYYPSLAKVVWQEYDANLYDYKKYSNRNLTYRVVDKVKRTLSKEKNIQRNWEVFYMHPEGRKKLEDILLNNKGLEDFVPGAKIKQLLDEFYKSPSAAHGYTVSMLLTFTLFLNRIYS